MKRTKDLITADYAQLTNKTYSSFGILLLFFSSAGFRAVVLYRFGHKFHKQGNRVLCAATRSLMFHWCQCQVSMGAQIGPGFCIRHTGAIVIGGRTEIGRNCDIRQGVTFGGNMGKQKNQRTQPKVGDDVLCGAGAKILGPVEIGNKAIIGANAVVVKDVRAGAVVGGVPAREIHTEYLGIEVDMKPEIESLKNRLSKIESTLIQFTKSENVSIRD